MVSDKKMLSIQSNLHRRKIQLSQKFKDNASVLKCFIPLTFYKYQSHH